MSIVTVGLAVYLVPLETDYLLQCDFCLSHATTDRAVLQHAGMP